MDGVLSQEEINALLNDTGDHAEDSGSELSDVEKDAVGEVANISMGSAATALSSLVNHKVNISTPVVTIASWDDIVDAYERPCVFIQIAYTVGLDGTNLLVLKDHDVKVITDLMMGGDGTNINDELGEIHLSAIGEAMNQMMGSAATSVSSMLNKMIDISPPVANVVDLKESVDEGSIDEFLLGRFVRITFKMEIGDLVNSEIMQLYPFSFAKEICDSVMNNMSGSAPALGEEQESQAAPQPMPQQAGGQPAAGQMQAGGQPMTGQTPMGGQPMTGQMPMGGQPMMGQMPMGGQPMMDMSQMYAQQPVNVQPAQFQPFIGDFNPITQKENIDLIMDVPLNVTVELGRTSKSIQEILDFSPGTIIELNKIAGEPIDVLVNGKYVAKGEVVVIEESFGIRITEIIKN